jgi:hypothetical protein
LRAVCVGVCCGCFVVGSSSRLAPISRSSLARAAAHQVGG